MEACTAERSSGRGRSKVARRLRRCLWVGGGAAGGVVVVAEVFAAETDAAAAMAVGEDVAAEVALGFGVVVVFGGDDLVLHGWVSLPGDCVQSIQRKRPESGLRDQVFCFAVKCAGPAFGRALGLNF